MEDQSITLGDVFFQMTGWTTYEISRCGYLPDVGERAENPGGGCQNTATVILGYRDEYYLCGECAALPRFKRFKYRRELTDGDAE